MFLSRQAAGSRDRRPVIATFTQETSRNLDLQLHTHTVIANVVQGADHNQCTMADAKLYCNTAHEPRGYALQQAERRSSDQGDSSG